MEQTSVIIAVISSGLPAITVAALCITSAGVISSLSDTIAKVLNLRAGDASTTLNAVSVDLLRSGIGFVILGIGITIEQGIPESSANPWVDDIYTCIWGGIPAFAFLIRALFRLRQLFFPR